MQIVEQLECLSERTADPRRINRIKRSAAAVGFALLVTVLLVGNLVADGGALVDVALTETGAGK